MSTLAEIEAAVDALPSSQQEALFRHLAERLKKRSEPKRTLPLVPATGWPITQEEIDDAIDTDSVKKQFPISKLMRRTSGVIPFLAAFALIGGGGAFAQTEPGMNPIQIENAKEGTSDWVLTKYKPKGPTPPIYAPVDEPYDRGWEPRIEIEGFVSHTSIRPGETLTVFVSTNPASEYTIDFYRMGYYGGKGGRLVKSSGPLQGVAHAHPADGERSLIECQWTEGMKFEIPEDWVSGVYLGKMHAKESDREGYVIFIVRDDRPADLLFQCSDLTWLSYNRWPKFRSLYDAPNNPWGSNNRTPVYDVGFDRPYALYWNGFPAGYEPLTNGSGEFLMIEFPLAFWLEKEGYDVSYISNVDTHVDYEGLLRAKGWLSVGHDEYWTRQMYENMTRAREAGLNLAFLSGNSVSGEVELRPSTDGRPNRVIRRVGGMPNGGADLMGSRTRGVGLADWVCQEPDHWVFEGTNMRKGDRIEQLVGWEYHGGVSRQHPDLVVLASGPVYGWRGNVSNNTYDATIYTAPKGNFVFNAATCWWNMVLSTPPGFMVPPKRFFMEDDARVQRITKNVLDRIIATDVIER